MTTIDILTKFYTSFSEKDAEGMLSCYDDNIVFTDPAFGTLEGDRAKAMWKMLLANEESDLNVSFKILEHTPNTGKVNWVATYYFGPQKRKVINNITANLTIKDGKIIKHLDHFSLWKWTQQALGFSGLFLGWSPFMKKKIQQRTNRLLDKFMNQK